MKMLDFYNVSLQKKRKVACVVEAENKGERIKIDVEIDKSGSPIIRIFPVK